MRRWLKIAVPLGIAAVLVAVLAIGFGSPSSQAAKPSAEPVAVDGCMGDGSEAVDISGRASSTAAHTFEFCSDPTLNMAVFLRWDSAKKDLALVVTEPDGTRHLVDTHGQNDEGYYQAATLPSGTWTIEVENHSQGQVDYTVSLFFFH